MTRFIYVASFFSSASNSAESAPVDFSRGFEGKSSPSVVAVGGGGGGEDLLEGEEDETLFPGKSSNGIISVAASVNIIVCSSCDGGGGATGWASAPTMLAPMNGSVAYDSGKPWMRIFSLRSVMNSSISTCTAALRISGRGSSGRRFNLGW